MENLDKIVGYFEPGKTPTYEEFKKSWTSFFHKSEKFSTTQVLGLGDALNTLDETKASKEELAAIGEGMRPMGRVETEAELRAIAAPNDNDSYYVNETKDENGDPYIWRFDKNIGANGDWVNTMQVVYKDVAKKSEVVLKPEFETLSDKCISYTNNNIDLLPSDFTNATLNGSNNPIPSDTRILSSLVALIGASYIEASVSSGYKLIIDFYNVAGYWVSRPIEAWLYAVKWDTYGVAGFRIRIIHADGKSPISPADINNVGLSIKVITEKSIKAATSFDDYSKLAEKCFIAQTSEMLVDASQFINATLSSSNAPTPNASRLLSRFYMVEAKIAVYVSVNTSYRTMIDLYDRTNTWIRRNSESWMPSATLDLTGGFCYTIRVMRADGSELLPSEIQNTGIKVVLTDTPQTDPAAPYSEFKPISEAVPVLNTNFNLLSEECLTFTSNELVLLSSDFTNATLNGSNNPTPSNTRILSAIKALNSVAYISASVYTTYKLIIDFYDASGKWLRRPSESWLYSVNWKCSDVSGFRIRLMKADGSDISPADLDKIGRASCRERV